MRITNKKQLERYAKAVNMLYDSTNRTVDCLTADQVVMDSIRAEGRNGIIALSAEFAAMMREMLELHVNMQNACDLEMHLTTYFAHRLAWKIRDQPRLR